MREGTVVEYHREYCWVELDGGAEVIAKPRGRLELDEQKYAQQLTVGDRVSVDEAEPGSFAIEALQPRETWLLRKNLGSYRLKPQCIVANADQLAVVIAPIEGELNLNIADRYFLAAIMGGITPLLIVNKIDLAPGIAGSPDTRCYEELGYKVHFTAAKDSLGLDGLRESLASKLTAFCGHSGVGKSTLLRALTGRTDINIGAVNQLTSKGRQTTTTSRIYHVPGSGMVVDTPGIKEFGLHELDWTEVQGYFSDIGTLALRCNFRDCLHSGEPNCAVRGAVEAGVLSARRLDSYIKLRQEAAEQEAAF